VVLAVGAAWGVRAWLVHDGTQSAQTAVLSCDLAAADRVDPSLASAIEPAAALGQSILRDEVVDGLAKVADLSASTRAARIGEFRTRLTLRESGQMLAVQFHGDNAERSAQTANAVAAVLTKWTPLEPASQPQSQADSSAQTAAS